MKTILFSRPNKVLAPAKTALQAGLRPEWINEVKADGYRLMVRREGKRVRTRRSHDWTHRFGELAEAISSIPRISSLTINGEACVCGSGGVPVFALLHSGSYDSAVVLYAFDLLELNGKDLRTEPLVNRKAKLAKLLEKADASRLGYTDHTHEDGSEIFRHACKLGYEGIVSKRRDFSYRSGRCKAWVKVKNPNSLRPPRLSSSITCHLHPCRYYTLHHPRTNADLRMPTPSVPASP